eukprot:COSAG02_NODE_1581_length_11839_cov_9.055451_8_plen_106_part_00
MRDQQRDMRDQQRVDLRKLRYTARAPGAGRRTRRMYRAAHSALHYGMLQKLDKVCVHVNTHARPIARRCSGADKLQCSGTRSGERIRLLCLWYFTGTVEITDSSL